MVVSWEKGQVSDYKILSKRCNVFEQQETRWGLDSDGFREWMEVHQWFPVPRGGDPYCPAHVLPCLISSSSHHTPEPYVYFQHPHTLRPGVSSSSPAAQSPYTLVKNRRRVLKIVLSPCFSSAVENIRLHPQL